MIYRYIKKYFVIGIILSLLACSEDQSTEKSMYLDTLKRFDSALLVKNAVTAASLFTSTATLKFKRCGKESEIKTAKVFFSRFAAIIHRLDIYERAREIADSNLSKSGLIVTSFVTERAVLVGYDHTSTSEEIVNIEKTKEGYRISSINSVVQCE